MESRRESRVVVAARPGKRGRRARRVGSVCQAEGEWATHAVLEGAAAVWGPGVSGTRASDQANKRADVGTGR